MRLDILEEMQCVFSFKVDLRRKPRGDCSVYPPVIKRCMENHQMIFQQYLQFPIAMFDYQRVMTDYGSFIGAHVSYVQTWGRPSKWQFY